MTLGDLLVALNPSVQGVECDPKVVIDNGNGTYSTIKGVMFYPTLTSVKLGVPQSRVVIVAQEL